MRLRHHGRRRAARGLNGELRSTVPRHHCLAEVGDCRAKVGVDEFAAHARLDVPPGVARIHFTLEAAAYAVASIRVIVSLPSATITDAAASATGKP